MYTSRHTLHLPRIIWSHQYSGRWTVIVLTSRNEQWNQLLFISSKGNWESLSGSRMLLWWVYTAISASFFTSSLRSKLLALPPWVISLPTFPSTMELFISAFKLMITSMDMCGKYVLHDMNLVFFY